MPRVTMRLYRQHDLDLVTYYRLEGFKFQKALKEALRAFAENKDFVIDPGDDCVVEDGYVPTIMQVQLYLNRKKDQDIIDLLSKVRFGFKGAFLKAVFRLYAVDIPLKMYYRNDDYIFNEEKDYITEHHDRQVKKSEKNDNSHNRHKKSKHGARADDRPKGNERSAGEPERKDKDVRSESPDSSRSGFRNDKLPFSSDNRPQKGGGNSQPAKTDNRNPKQNEGQNKQQNRSAGTESDRKPDEERHDSKPVSQAVKENVPENPMQAQAGNDSGEPQKEHTGGAQISSVVSDDSDGGEDLSSILAVMDKIAHS